MLCEFYQLISNGDYVDDCRNGPIKISWLLALYNKSEFIHFDIEIILTAATRQKIMIFFWGGGVGKYAYRLLSVYDNYVLMVCG